MSHNIITVDSTNPDVNSKIQTVEYIQFGRGEFPSSPSINIDVDDTFPFYDTSPVNNIVGATLNQTGDILDSIDLPAGKYLVFVNTGGVSCTSTGFNNATYYFTGSTTQINPIASLVGTVPAEYMKTFRALYCPSYLILSSATTCYVKCGFKTTLANPASSTSARYAHTSSLTILRVE